MSITGKGRKQPTAISRMKQDYMRLKRDPLPYITAEPLPNNILEWHYVVKGPEDSPYYGGYYHGTLLFPREFPFKPPSIYMLTPNGRFRTNSRLCLSISDFHPDTWNPTWCVGTILTGLLSFMLETTPTLGSIETSSYEKQQLAHKSMTFNLENSNFRELFPDIVDEIQKRLQDERIKIMEKSGIKNKNLTSNNHNNINNHHNGNNEVPGMELIENSNQVADGGAKTSKSSLNWQAFYTNLIIVISFAIFALIVNYVFKNLNQE